MKSDFPEVLAAPAIRALHNAKIRNLKAISKFTEAEISGLHGIGPNAITKLSKALKSKKLSFRKS